jgi:hypothetical protein
VEKCDPFKEVAQFVLENERDSVYGKFGFCAFVLCVWSDHRRATSEDFVLS